MSTNAGHTSEHHPIGEHPQGSSPLFLAFALFGGTVPWTVHLIAGYSIANYWCGDTLAMWLLHGLTVVTATISGVAFITSWRLLVRSSREPPGQRAPEVDRDQFLASGGLVLAGLGFMAIVFGEFAVVAGGCAP